MKPSPIGWILGITTGVLVPAAGTFLYAMDRFSGQYGPPPGAGVAALALTFPACLFMPLIGELALLAAPPFWFAVFLLVGRRVESRKGRSLPPGE